MKKFIEFIRSLFIGKKQEVGCIVNIDDIVISKSFQNTRIGDKKWKHKIDYYLNAGILESKIVIRKSDWVLVDGYSSYKIAKKFGIKKVEVFFE